jgi:hypothetical protein
VWGDVFGGDHAEAAGLVVVVAEAISSRVFITKEPG